MFDTASKLVMLDAGADIPGGGGECPRRADELMAWHHSLIPWN